MNMTTTDITAYLKDVSELEASIERQERIIQNTKALLQSQTPKMPYIAKPEEPKLDSIKPKMETIEQDESEIRKNFLYGIITIVVCILFVVPSLLVKFDEVGLLYGSVVFVAGIFVLLRYRRDSQEIEEKKASITSQYKKRVLDSKQKYEKEKKAYIAKVEEETVKLDEKKKRHSIAQAAARQLDAPYAETKETLRKLYDLNIIFPKYRNFVAMSTMYEYLASGRCSELTGADGAYNLYESELRQNIIINELSTIITKLEDIKQNQYVLYQELKKTDRILSDISGDMKELLSTTHEIADASKITAFCSQVTAQNTEALKYIKTFSRYRTIGNAHKIDICY